MIQRLRIAPIGLLVFGATSACQASQSDVRGAETSQQPAANSAASRPVAADHTGNNVTNEQASQKAIVGNNLNIRFLNDARSYGLRARWNF